MKFVRRPVRGNYLLDDPDRLTVSAEGLLASRPVPARKLVVIIHGANVRSCARQCDRIAVGVESSAWASEVLAAVSERKGACRRRETVVRVVRDHDLER